MLLKDGNRHNIITVAYVIYKAIRMITKDKSEYLRYITVLNS